MVLNLTRVWMKICQIGAILVQVLNGVINGTLCIQICFHSSIFFERNLSVNGSNVVGGNSEGSAIGLGAFAQNEYNKVIDYALRIDNQLPIGNNNIEI